MVHDFFNGVGGGLLILLGLGALGLFALWISLPILVLRLVQTNRTLAEEVRSLRRACEKEQGEEDAPPTASEEGSYGE